MHRYFPVCVLVILITVLGAGCTEAGSSSAAITPTVSPANVTTPATIPPVTTVPTLSLGNQYLSESYAFSGMNNTYSDQIRITDPSWAISYTVTDLSSNPRDCLFAIKVTNLDTLSSRTITWTYLNESFQQYPMYTPGLYQFAMTGSLVKVDLTVAQRLP